MVFYHTNECRAGLKIVVDDEPYTIVASEFIKPGKGQAFTRLKIRNLKNNRVIERTYKSGERVEAAEVMEIEAQYLYRDGETWYFMEQTSFEQFPVTQGIVAEAARWLKGEEHCRLMLWNGTPLSVITPNFVELSVIDTDPGVRGDTSSGGSKPATMETGVVIKVPLFIEAGELIRIDTRTGEYIRRVKPSSVG